MILYSHIIFRHGPFISILRTWYSTKWLPRTQGKQSITLQRFPLILQIWISSIRNVCLCCNHIFWKSFGRGFCTKAFLWSISVCVVFVFFIGSWGSIQTVFAGILNNSITPKHDRILLVRLFYFVVSWVRSLGRRLI